MTMDQFEEQFGSPKPDSQSLILQRTSGLIQYVEDNYGDDATITMSLVAIEVNKQDGSPPDVLMRWGDDRHYVKTGFLDVMYEELDLEKALANKDRMQEALEDEEDEDE